ncbi:MAG: GldG family protein [Spirochaetia bacterium]
MNKKTQEIIIFILVIAVIFFLGLNSVRYFFRVDLTQNQIYTLSDVSRNLYQEIPEQINITYYVSERLKNLYPEPELIEDVLYEYAAHSRGKIRVDVVDPVQEGIADQVEQMGIVPNQIGVRDEAEQSFAIVYSGLSIQYLDRQEIIPVIGTAQSLEYQLTSRIRQIVENSERIVGVLMGNESRNFEQDYQQLKSQIERNYTLRMIERGENISDDVSMLLVLGSRSLDDFDLYPVDQYVMNGGNALFAVDGVPLDLNSFAPATGENEETRELLSSYGIDIQEALILDTSSRAIPVSNQRGGYQLMPYPHWIQLTEEGVASDLPVTQNFSGLDLLWASPIELNEQEGIEYTELLRTSEEAWTMSGENIVTAPEQAASFAMTRDVTTGQYLVGVSAQGAFPSYFTDREIPTREGEDREWSDPVELAEGSHVIVIPDSDFPSMIAEYSLSSNMFSNQNSLGYNIGFIDNCIEWLSSDDDLLSIKNRVNRDLRLNNVKDEAAESAIMIFAQVLNIVIIPLLVIVYGVVRFFLRKRRETNEVMEEKDAVSN